jgi:membrane protein insertase Oxa1/YidC/SpoIIIJ
MKFTDTETINTSFLYLDLAKPDPYLIVTLLAVALQFFYTKMLMPVTKEADKAVKKTPGQTDDIMQSMQKQNMYIMPFMFLIFGLTLPSGVIIYITTSTLIQFAQTIYYNGVGGLEPMLKKIKVIKN